MNINIFNGLGIVLRICVGDKAFGLAAAWMSKRDQWSRQQREIRTNSCFRSFL